MDSVRNMNDTINSESDYFIYTDADVYQNEIAELYSYTELSEFRQNYRAYVLEIGKFKETTKWSNLEGNTQRSFIMAMIDRLDMSDHQSRIFAARCILYLIQGCWMESKSLDEQQEWTRKNVFLLYKLGAFSSFMDLLNIELEKTTKTPKVIDGDCEDTHVSMNDSVTLRLIINVLYILIETIRTERDKKNLDFCNIALELSTELSSPLPDDEMLQIKLLNMMLKYCNGTAAHFPIKKIVLLLWKSTLLMLGGMQSLKDQKNNKRINAGLQPIQDDTLDMIKQMHATVLIDEDSHISRKTPTVGKRVKAALFENLNEEASAFLKRQQAVSPIKSSKSVQRDTKVKETINVVENPIGSPKCATATPKASSSPNTNCKDSGSALLFKPKVRKSDIEKFLQNARQKYFGYTLCGDQETLVGLPEPIHESIQALRRHLYVSLGELQISAEEDKHFNRLGHINNQAQEGISPAELLYRAMLPNIDSYVRDLLLLILAASPTAKLTAGDINSRIITDMLPKNPSQTTIFSSTMKSDVLRHKEIILKATSAFLLLCVKHFKLDHIYHSEYFCQLLVQFNFIKLVLQFFSSSIGEYVHAMTNIPMQEFPACVILQETERSEVTVDASNDATGPSYSWRNLFACINLLRLLNKVVKWKPSRIVNMVFLKSVGVLKDSLKIQQPAFQLYVLKLLKMQAKFLGRNWRRHNLKVLTAIYTKVRPRFNDDWAYGCKTVGDYWGAQEDEMASFFHVRDYHLRRFPFIQFKGFCPSICKDSNAFQSSSTEIRVNLKTKSSECVSLDEKNEKKISMEVDDFLSHSNLKKCMRSLPLMEPLNCLEQLSEGNEDLPEEFKKNYEIWLENQIFNCSFNWDLI